MPTYTNVFMMPLFKKSTPNYTTHISLIEAETFSRFYDQTYAKVFRYICALCIGESTDAEDITAESYMKAWKARWRFYGSEEAALGWLLVIAKRQVLDFNKRYRRKPFDRQENAPEIADIQLLADAQMQHAEQQELVHLLLGQLTEDMGEILVLRYTMDWTVKDIAIHLDMKENTVTVKIKRALESLQRRFPHLIEHLS